jgi:hypothetical protein
MTGPAEASDDDPFLRRIVRHPVKSLDPEPCESIRIGERGGLVGDREWAIVDAPAGAPHDPVAASPGGSGDYVNGKKTAAVHRLRSSVDREAGTLTLREQGSQEARVFDLEDRERLNEWLSAYFGREVSVRRHAEGQPDDTDNPGPTVVSTATLRTVASWFDFDLASARRRFRTTLEVGGVPAFWEDRLYADRGEAVAFEVGGTRVHGVTPCQRCVVPGRDPDTGEETPGFRERFLERREATLPDWLDSERFDHPFRLTVNTVVPGASRGERLAVGDPVCVEGVVPRGEGNAGGSDAGSA